MNQSKWGSKIYFGNFIYLVLKILPSYRLLCTYNILSVSTGANILLKLFRLALFVENLNVKTSKKVLNVNSVHGFHVYLSSHDTHSNLSKTPYLFAPKVSCTVIGLN